MREGRTGSGRSSPSERLPAVAVTLNAAIRTWRGAASVEGDVRAAALADLEGADEIGRPQAEVGRQVAIAVGIDDGQANLARQVAGRGVVDDDLQLRLVPLAQEARHVGADHQILDALGLLVQRARGQVIGDGVNPYVPGRDRIGNGELQGRGAVGTGEQVWTPERRLGEVGAQLGRRRACAGRRGGREGVLRGSGSGFPAALGGGRPRREAGHLPHRGHGAGRRQRGHRSAVFGFGFRSEDGAPRKRPIAVPSPPTGPADPVARVELQPVAVKLGTARRRGPASRVDPAAERLAQAVRQAGDLRRGSATGSIGDGGR